MIHNNLRNPRNHRHSGAKTSHKTPTQESELLFIGRDSRKLLGKDYIVERNIVINCITGSILRYEDYYYNQKEHNL